MRTYPCQPTHLLLRHPRGAVDAVHGLLSGGCGDLSAERKFPSDKVYRRDDRGIVEVESRSPQGLAFVVIHASVGLVALSLQFPFMHGRFWSLEG
jgi:hypothetical protein